ncbi:MAG: zinc ABC transporter substrate-binding protein [Treponema sp.]|nr:zinc ABC transporter substrate-binding protein [Treponema sp.]MCL2272531.1 zinc ABC transporter substrate-binding protein [Treponema sp.]
MDEKEKMPVNKVKKIKIFLSASLRPRAVLITLFSMLIISCSRQVSNDSILIAVSIPPQKWFVSQIAGDKADVLILVPPEQNPHNYEPSPRQIKSLSGASAWILSGSEFEISLRPKIEGLFPNLKIIDGTAGVNFRRLEDHDHHEAQQIVHSALEIDRHTWLGREPAKILAFHIGDFLSVTDKENGDYYRQRYENLCREIDIEFDKLRITLAPLNGRTVFVYHPSFGYFFDEFGINQEAVETGGKEPGPKQLNELIHKLTEEKAFVIFVQAQFPVNTAKTLADAAGAQVIILDPLAEDWMENIRLMGKALQRTIQ